MELMYEEKSKLCMRSIYNLVDGTLDDDIIHKMSKFELVSLVIQLVIGVYLMSKERYYHGDINKKNIGYFLTQDKYIRVVLDNNSFDVQLFGKRFILIDYGNVIHPDFIMTSYEKTKIMKYIDLHELDYIFFGYVISDGSYLKT